MQIPRNKQTLAVFLRDYGGRRKKSRAEKIAIMTKVLADKAVTIDNVRIKLDDGQWDLINGLYHKYVLGKWNAHFTENDILSLYKDTGIGFTIHEIAEELECTDEIVRRRVKTLVNSGTLMRGVNPENKRQGVFFMKRKHIMPMTEAEVA